MSTDKRIFTKSLAWLAAKIAVETDQAQLTYLKALQRQMSEQYLLSHIKSRQPKGGKRS